MAKDIDRHDEYDDKKYDFLVMYKDGDSWIRELARSKSERDRIIVQAQRLKSDSIIVYPQKKTF